MNSNNYNNYKIIIVVIGIHQGACSFRCHTKNNNNREDLNWNRGWRWSPRLGFGSLEYADYTF